jgi:hypothetical protein
MSAPWYFYASLILTLLSTSLLFVIIFRTDLLVVNNSSDMSYSDSLQSQNMGRERIVGDSGIGAGTATSGRLFRGDRIRTYDTSLLQHADERHKKQTSNSAGIDEHVGDLFCNHWSVVTTIFEPSEAVKRQAQLQDWCLVIVGDKKGPKEYPIPTSMHAHNANKTDNVVYLTVEKQIELEAHLPLLSNLPWNHFGRKNVGYLYAILHGALVVWDFDDDNELLRSDGVLELPGMESGVVPIVRRLHAYQFTPEDELKMKSHVSKPLGHRKLSRLVGAAAESEQLKIARLQKSLAVAGVRRQLKEYVLDSKTFPAVCKAREVGVKGIGWPKEYAVLNPYPIMGAPSTPSWPRGLPLELIKKGGYSSTLSDVNVPIERVGVVQSLANGDPDVDAIYRLTQPLPFSFPQHTPDSRNIRPLNVKSQSVGETIIPLLVPAHAYAPYNAQATLHMYPALWSLLLPVTVHGRVSDIWRGYLAQKLFRDVGLELLFSPPLVRQDRNVHNYIGDLESEGPLYARAHVLVSQLNELQLKNSVHNFAGRMEELWVWAYERDYLQLQDVVLCQTWIDSLRVIGYKFPPPKQK